MARTGGPADFVIADRRVDIGWVQRGSHTEASGVLHFLDAALGGSAEEEYYWRPTEDLTFSGVGEVRVEGRLIQPSFGDDPLESFPR